MNSITWNPIQAPDLTSVANLYGTAGNYITSGMQGLTNIADAQHKINQNKAEQQSLDQANKAKAFLLSNVKSPSDFNQMDMGQLLQGLDPSAASNVIDFVDGFKKQLTDAESSKAKLIEANAKQRERDNEERLLPFKMANTQASTLQTQAQTEKARVEAIKDQKEYIQNQFGASVSTKLTNKINEAFTKGNYSEEELRKEINQMLGSVDKENNISLTPDQQDKYKKMADSMIEERKKLSDAQRAVLNNTINLAKEKIYNDTGYYDLVQQQQNYKLAMDQNAPDANLYSERANLETLSGLYSWLEENKVPPEKQHTIATSRLTNKILDTIADPSSKKDDITQVRNAIAEAFPPDFPEDVKRDILDNISITTEDNMAALGLTRTEANLFQNITTLFSNGIEESSFKSRRVEALYSRVARRIKYLDAQSKYTQLEKPKKRIEDNADVVIQTIRDSAVGFKIDNNSKAIYERTMGKPFPENKKSASDIQASLNRIYRPNNNKSYVAQFGRRDSSKNKQSLFV